METAVYKVDLANLVRDPCPAGTKRIQIHGGLKVTGYGSEANVGTVHL